MTEKIRRARKQQAGFTLIELLVVILLVGILAAIAIPQYFALIERGHLAEAMGCISTLKVQMERARLANGFFPGVANVLALNPAPLNANCRGMKYFTGSVNVGIPGAYTIQLMRNNVAFSAASGAIAGYSFVMTHNDGAADAFGGGVPTSWLPN